MACGTMLNPLHARFESKRLVFMPLHAHTARSVLAGNLSELRHADGWPHADTRDALRTAAAVESPSFVWLVAIDGCVIGDCGTLGPIDANGDLEIGYGLAIEYRGRGYGTELVQALSRWLLPQAGVRRLVAHVATDNAPSRRALERAGYVLDRVGHAQVLRYHRRKSVLPISAPPAI
jgi:RimJ/RimL family protein N-acetyltransferase